MNFKKQNLYDLLYDQRLETGDGVGTLLLNLPLGELEHVKYYKMFFRFRGENYSVPYISINGVCFFHQSAKTCNKDNLYLMTESLFEQEEDLNELIACEKVEEKYMQLNQMDLNDLLERGILYVEGEMVELCSEPIFMYQMSNYHVFLILFTYQENIYTVTYVENIRDGSSIFNPSFKRILQEKSYIKGMIECSTLPLQYL